KKQLHNNFRWLDFKITNRCNNNCVYCQGQNDPPESSEKLSYKVIKETLADAIEANFNYICFLGGEPSIRNDINEIIKVVGNQSGISLRLITNLKIYREEMYEALFSTESRDSEIVVSFENFSYPNYKRVDPKISMERIEKINKLAIRYESEFRNSKKRSISLHSVISRENFQKIDKFVEFFYNKKIDVTLGLVCPSIFCDNPKAYNEFQKSEIQIIIDQLNKLEKEGKLNWANKVLRDFLKIYTFGNFSHRGDCWAGKKQVIINSDGQVFPCISESYLTSNNYGNIKEERFKKILKRLENFSCSLPPNSACWDHFLWDRLAKKIEKGE
ncbi:MAG: radical SAM protein, partial [Candidatus Lokiarchaeota archaeon]|nr:radical SAM protein [Candidatus Lokiarchaeota archaeon]